MRVVQRYVAAWAFAIVLAVAGVAQAQAPAPGSSVETAIVLPGIQHETQGVDAEYTYIKKNFPGWKLKSQSLISNKGKQYDAIQLTGPDGSAKTVFFDITAWFGK